MSTIDIQGWFPQKWDQVVGNGHLVEHFKGVLKKLKAGAVKVPATLIIGPSQSGKTGVTKLFVKSIICENPDPNTLNPCSACRMCNYQAVRFGLDWWECETFNGAAAYVPVDCTNIKSDELDNKLSGLREFAAIRLVYLDEVHRLHRPGNPLEEKLLKPMQDSRFTWIASSITTAKLDPAFLKRFYFKIRTELPSKAALVDWLDGRCQEWRIDWENAETLYLLAKRANLVPGLALQVLAAADMRTPRCVTRKLVEEHVFDFEE